MNQLVQKNTRCSIELNSLSNFWLQINDKQEIVSASEYFIENKIDSGQLHNHFEFIQPFISREEIKNSDLLNRILQLKALNTGIFFRFTGHSSDDQLTLIGWPLFSTMEEIRSHNLVKKMNHPASLITDLIIFKDVLKRNQETIQSLQALKYEKELEEERRIAFHQSKLATIGELAAGVAHEINNPLAVAMGFGEILKKNIKKEAIDQEKMIETLEKQSKAHYRIKNIVQGLQNYARTDAVVESAFSLDEICKQTIELMTELLEKKNVKFTYSNHCPEVNIKGISGEMQQVLTNLITNSGHALEQQEDKKINIQIDYADTTHVLIAVSDNGPGIKKEIMGRIFQPFFTTKEAGKGTGLGLAISQKIIKKMKGDIRVESEPGHSTTFFILLPIAN